MSARDGRHPIDPADWLVEWSLNPRRAAEAVTTQAVTPWFVGTTKPVRKGWYDRMFTDGLFSHYWDGYAWCSGKGGPPHWRQVGDYPCWRGMLAPVADRDAAAFDAYCRAVGSTFYSRRDAFHAGIAHGRRSPQ